MLGVIVVPLGKNDKGISAAELVKNRTEVELTALQERIWQEYELTYEGALSYKQELSFTRSQRQTDQIRR